MLAKDARTHFALILISDLSWVVGHDIPASRRRRRFPLVNQAELRMPPPAQQLLVLKKCGNSQTGKGGEHVGDTF